MTGFFEMLTEDQTIEQELKKYLSGLQELKKPAYWKIVCQESSYKNYQHIREIPSYLIVNSDSTSTCIPSEIIIH